MGLQGILSELACKGLIEPKLAALQICLSSQLLLPAINDFYRVNQDVSISSNLTAFQ